MTLNLGLEFANAMKDALLGSCRIGTNLFDGTIIIREQFTPKLLPCTLVPRLLALNGVLQTFLGSLCSGVSCVLSSFTLGFEFSLQRGGLLRLHCTSTFRFRDIPQRAGESSVSV